MSISLFAHIESRGLYAGTKLHIAFVALDAPADYPDDDLQALMGDDGKWQFVHKNVTPY